MSHPDSKAGAEQQEDVAAEDLHPLINILLLTPCRPRKPHDGVVVCTTTSGAPNPSDSKPGGGGETSPQVQRGKAETIH